MPVKLILYSTSHCHLCEQAESLLKIFEIDNNLLWETVEISENMKLLELYATKIPVLRRMDKNIEIAWPFTASEIANLINPAK